MWLGLQTVSSLERCPLFSAHYGEVPLECIFTPVAIKHHPLLSEVAWHSSAQLNPAQPVGAHTQVPSGLLLLWEPLVLLPIVLLASKGLHLVVHHCHSDVNLSRVEIG